MLYDIPILFIIFRRKDVALQSLQRIRSVQPAKLYIAADGPRTGVEGEAQAVEQTRQAVLSAIDWPCDVKTLFQTENLGCSKGPYTAISWLFDNEEQGIILEDDCMAEQSFFPFMQELLQRYQHDDRIGMIAGTNQLDDRHDMVHSYCFSKYAACWGWATWRRAWINMRIDLDFLTEQRTDVLKNRGFKGKEDNRWNYQLEMIRRNRVSAWDWQWYFSLAAQNQLCIFPCANLISNIGNDAEATHTAFSEIFIKSRPMAFPLKHPTYILPDYQFDKDFFKKENSIAARVKRHIPYALKQFIKRHIH